MSENQTPCLISDMRTCHALGPKDVVFIIGSGLPDFKEDIDAIAEILDGFGFKGYFALLSEEAKGLDVFCDKICSKIKEAPFCVAMLNDPVVFRHIEGTAEGFEPMRVPSANVYYEFGMAVAFGKSVIPVIRSGSKLPFDIQHLDAIIYDNVNDLKRKLKKSIVATLKKKTKEVVVPSHSELVKVVYGPLYNEVDRFLSRRDKIATFNRSEYGTILTQHKYLLDTIDADLHKKITTFYDKIDAFNSCLPVAERIIHEIVVKQISDTFKIPADGSLSISVELETDSGSHILPTLDQILIRKTTPKLFLRVQGSREIIRKVTYKLRMADYKEKEIEPKVFRLFFKKCREAVESNTRIVRLRELRIDLGLRGRALKEKLKQFCR